MLFEYHSNSLGLDISEKRLRLIQLKKTRRKAQIVSFNEVNLPAGVMQNGKIIEAEKFIYCLKDLIKNARGQRVTTKQINACLPEPQTFIKLISISYPEEKNLVEEIINETQKHIPYALDKTYLDWQFINGNDKSKVLIAISPKEIVDNYQEILNKTDFILSTLEIEAVAICRSLLEFNKKIDDPLIILDLGANRTSLIIYQDQSILYSLSIDFSTEKLTTEIKNCLKISDEEAEKAKRLCGLDPQKSEGGVKKILMGTVNKLAEHIREAKYFYHEHFSKEKTIKNVLLTGGGSLLPNLTNYLSEQCQLNITIADPLTNIVKSDKFAYPLDLQSYTTAIGLALRNIQ